MKVIKFLLKHNFIDFVRYFEKKNGLQLNILFFQDSHPTERVLAASTIEIFRLYIHPVKPNSNVQ